MAKFEIGEYIYAIIENIKEFDDGHKEYKLRGIDNYFSLKELKKIAQEAPEDSFARTLEYKEAEEETCSLLSEAFNNDTFLKDNYRTNDISSIVYEIPLWKILADYRDFKKRQLLDIGICVNDKNDPTEIEGIIIGKTKSEVIVLKKNLKIKRYCGKEIQRLEVNGKKSEEMKKVLEELNFKAGE